MKKLLSILGIAIMLFAFGAADMSAKDKNKKNEAVAVFTVTPQMHCQNCENKIKSNLRFENGVKNIATSLKEQTVTIKYNPKKTDEKKLVEAFEKIGYTATPADAPAPSK